MLTFIEFADFYVVMYAYLRVLIDAKPYSLTALRTARVPVNLDYEYESTR